MQEQRFRTKNGDWYDNHHIDFAGNHFINKKCVNPKCTDLALEADGVWRHAKIGHSYPDGETDVYPQVLYTSSHGS